MTDQEFCDRMEALTRRHEAITMNVELISHEMEAMRARTDQLLIATEGDTENIRALVRIAEVHESRRSDLEGESLE